MDTKRVDGERNRLAVSRDGPAFEDERERAAGGGRRILDESPGSSARDERAVGFVPAIHEPFRRDGETQRAPGVEEL